MPAPAIEQPSAGPVPRHVAVIMDGNGRWAEQRSLPRAAGHRAGARTVRSTIEHSVRRGVTALTLFAFSNIQISPGTQRRSTLTLTASWSP